MIAKNVDEWTWWPFSEERRIDWRDLFGRAAPVEVEVGSGKGRFIVETARRHPERSFLAIEAQHRWAQLLRERLDTSGLSNARALHADASVVVGRLLPPRSVARFHLYFPDPWWKRRHFKRRLVTPRFARALRDVLVPGGDVCLVTDVASRFHDMIDVFAAAGFEAELGESALPADRAWSDFERKYRQRGRAVHGARLVPGKPGEMSRQDGGADQVPVAATGAPSGEVIPAQKPS